VYEKIVELLPRSKERDIARQISIITLLDIPLLLPESEVIGGFSLTHIMLPE
jgi:hypothetical protein